MLSGHAQNCKVCNKYNVKSKTNVFCMNLDEDAHLI